MARHSVAISKERLSRHGASTQALCGGNQAGAADVMKRGASGWHYRLAELNADAGLVAKNEHARFWQ